MASSTRRTHARSPAIAVAVAALAIGACSERRTIDLCGRGDNPDLQGALLGGSFALELVDADGTVVQRLNAPADAPSRLSAPLHPDAVHVNVRGLDASGIVRATGDGAVVDPATCVCVALFGQHQAACAGVACYVQGGRCQFVDADTRAPIGTQEITLGEGADSEVQNVTDDTFLDEADADRNFGSGPTVVAGSTPRRVGLLRFDLGVLPRGTVIEKADLSLELRPEGQGSAEPVLLYRVREAWREGTHDDTPGCPNWTCRTDADAWTVPGCGHVSDLERSRDASPIASFVADEPGGRYAVEVTTAVAGWASDPPKNFGFALTTAAEALEFLASEARPELGARPELRIRYRLAGTPPGFVGWNPSSLSSPVLSVTSTVLE